MFTKTIRRLNEHAETFFFRFLSCTKMEIVGFCVFLQSQNKVYIKYNRIIVMAKELKDLTKRSENYSQWYNDLVVKADLAEQSPVRGCMVIKPYGFAIWE